MMYRMDDQKPVLVIAPIEWEVELDKGSVQTNYGWVYSCMFLK